VRQALLVVLPILDLQVTLVQLVKQGQRELQEVPQILDPLDIQDAQDGLVRPAHLVVLQIRVQRDILDLLAQPEQLVLQDILGQLGAPGRQVCLVVRRILALLGILEILEIQEQPEIRDQLVLLAIPGPLGPRELLVM